MPPRRPTGRPNGRPKGSRDTAPRRGSRTSTGHLPIPGPGRPKGSKGLPRGVRDALRVAHYRVPAGTAPELAVLADYALERILDVLGGRVSAIKAPHVLKAATRIRDEVCGLLAQNVRHDVGETLEEILRGMWKRSSAA